MSIIVTRPLDQPNHRRTARKVIRASSSPDRTCSSAPVLRRTISNTSSPLPASRIALVTKPVSRSTPSSSAICRHSAQKRSKAWTVGAST